VAVGLEHRAQLFSPAKRGASSNRGSRPIAPGGPWIPLEVGRFRPPSAWCPCRRAPTGRAFSTMLSVATVSANPHPPSIGGRAWIGAIAGIQSRRIGEQQPAHRRRNRPRHQRASVSLSAEAQLNRWPGCPFSLTMATYPPAQQRSRGAAGVLIAAGGQITAGRSNMGHQARGVRKRLVGPSAGPGQWLAGCL